MSDPNHPVSPAGSAPIAHSSSPLNLRSLTPARVALDRTGASITTRHALEFSLAHAQARDAVHSALAVPSLLAALRERGLAAIAVKSAARDRTEYLRRPDLGRTLSAPSAALLATNPGAPFMQPMSGHSREARTAPATLSIILADGLSALAAERHALPLLDTLLPLLAATWTFTPILLAEQARVALGDEIGLALHADLTVMLIGERPGLSSPDSLGAYITWAPHPGRTDAERNCVSNIRAEGLDYAAAAAKIIWYVNEGRRLGLTGVELRERDLRGRAGGLDSPRDRE
jgi:ethanolamine ammonia-lyase small subunit